MFCNILNLYLVKIMDDRPKRVFRANRYCELEMIQEAYKDEAIERAVPNERPCPIELSGVGSSGQGRSENLTLVQHGQRTRKQTSKGASRGSHKGQSD